MELIFIIHFPPSPTLVDVDVFKDHFLLTLAPVTITSFQLSCKRSQQLGSPVDVFGDPFISIHVSSSLLPDYEPSPPDKPIFPPIHLAGFIRPGTSARRENASSLKSLLQNEHLLRSAKNNLCGHPGEIVLGVALLRFRAISQLILAQNIFLSISLRRSFCKRL